MKFIGGLASILILAILSAFTISTLWGWFIVPFGLPSIGIAHAYGVALLAKLLTCDINTMRDKSEGIADSLIKGLVLNLVGLGLGYIAMSLM